MKLNEAVFKRIDELCKKKKLVHIQAVQDQWRQQECVLQL